MSAKIMNGKFVAEQLRKEFQKKISSLAKKGTTPGLAVILIGEDPASKIYVQNKINSCKNLGIHSRLHELPYHSSEDDVLKIIKLLNTDTKIHGILVQLPLPPHLNEAKILLAIDPEKDVDGFGIQHVGALCLGTPSIIPCTPSGIMELLNFYNINIVGKHVVIVGRSNIVGKPLALLLLAAGATITICHSKTQNLSLYTKQADIVAIAVGKPKFLKANMIKDGAIIIDIGINKDEKGKMCGDVDFQNILSKAKWITPVPGGVGPMTITMLLHNTINAAEKTVLNA